MSSKSPEFNRWMRTIEKRNFQFNDAIVRRQDAFQKNRVAWATPYNSPEAVIIPAHSSMNEENLPFSVQYRWRRLQYLHPLLSSVLRASFIAYEGELGMGKTLAAIEHFKLLNKIDSRFVLYTNVPIKDKSIPSFPIDFRQILTVGLYGTPFEHERVLVNLDEIQNFVDSRFSLSYINIIFSRFGSQIRKRKCKLVYTGSSAMLGDIRLRDLTKYVIKASKREMFDPKRECDDSECMGKHIFRYSVYKPLPDNKNRYIGRIIYNPEETKRTLAQFDSFDVPPPVETMAQDMIDKINAKIGSIGGKPIDDLSTLGSKPVIRPKLLELG